MTVLDSNLLLKRIDETTISHLIAFRRLLLSQNITQFAIVKTTRSNRLQSYDFQFSNLNDYKKLATLTELLCFATGSQDVTMRRIGAVMRVEVLLPVTKWKPILFSEDMLPMQVGVDTGREPFFFNYAESDALIGGTKNSGKSNLIQCVLLTMMLHISPEHCRIGLIDTHRSIDGLERSAHLITKPAHTDEEVTKLIEYFVRQLIDRKAIGEYVIQKDKDKYPDLVLVIDEAADVDVLGYGKRLHDKHQGWVYELVKEGRKFGIKVVLGTQKPSEENLPNMFPLFVNRYIGQVGTEAASRLLTARTGLNAHLLTGKGDMFYTYGATVIRFFCSLVTKEVIAKIPQVDTVPDLPDFVRVPWSSDNNNEITAYATARYLTDNYTIDEGAEDFGLTRAMHNKHKKFAKELKDELKDIGFKIEADK